VDLTYIFKRYIFYVTFSLYTLWSIQE